MIKAAFFDIDGTLVGFHDAEIRDEVLEALEALRRKGIRLYISSGRPKALIRNLKDYPFDGYITMNGSLVTLGDEVIYSAPLPREAAVRIAEISEREGFAAVALMADGMGINLQEPPMGFGPELEEIAGACAGNREEALRKLRAALCELVIEGVDTNVEEQLRIIEDERFTSGNYDLTFMGNR